MQKIHEEYLTDGDGNKKAVISTYVLFPVSFATVKEALKAEIWR